MGVDLHKLRPPEKLNSQHKIDGFESGNDILDDWLKRRAFKNEVEGASRTYVLCAEDVVIGYYCLASGAIAQIAATGKVRRNMPDPVPVMVIGRLAVDLQWQSQGIGRALLKDAIIRILQAAEIGGIRAILVHAISEDVKRFYERCGFTPSPLEPMTLMVTLKDATTSLNP